MLEFLRRQRSPRALVATLILAWVVMVATTQASAADQSDLLTIATALVLVIGLVVTAFCLVKLAIHALGR